MSLEDQLSRAVALIKQADGLLITAGAGMGVDSGLPDFRGKNGFWNAYPALGRAKLNFEEIASPQAFDRFPMMAWGFYGHRLELYRQTVPNEGFAILRSIASQLEHGAFIFTSNVDGQFQKAGFSDDQICEVHGSIHHLQCLDGCERHIWSANELQPEIDAANCLMTSELPTCKHCGELARPNILMFNDWGWLPYRKQQQSMRMGEWLNRSSNAVIIEIGAGTAVPTVRRFDDQLELPNIRINPDEFDIQKSEDVGLPMTGMSGLKAIGQLNQWEGCLLPSRC